MEQDLQQLVYKKEDMAEDAAALKLKCEEKAQDYAMYLAEDEAAKILDAPLLRAKRGNP
jgi:hypothetical protein